MNPDKINAGDEIRIINAMLAYTRRRTAESGDFFIAWGVILLAALGVMWLLVLLEKYSYIWLDWILAMVVGAGYSYWKIKRLARRTRVKTYADMAIGGTWSALGIAFILVNFLGRPAGLYMDGWLSPYFMNLILAGCGVFISGFLLKTNLLVWAGVVWWIGAVILAFWGSVINPIGLYMLLLVIAYLVPGFYLKHSWK
ncbi:MAG: hypothetical protein ACETWG_08140 [Candidatus Neomarinimicrobiota bacterium]